MNKQQVASLGLFVASVALGYAALKPERAYHVETVVQPVELQSPVIVTKIPQIGTRPGETIPGTNSRHQPPHSVVIDGRIVYHKTSQHTAEPVTNASQDLEPEETTPEPNTASTTETNPVTQYHKPVVPVPQARIARTPVPDTSGPEVYQFDAEPPTIFEGQKSDICVGVSPDTQAITDEFGDVTHSLTQCYKVSPTQTTTYHLIAMKNNITVVRTATVNVRKQSVIVVPTDTQGLNIVIPDPVNTWESGARQLPEVTASP